MSAKTVALVVWDGVEELDLVGPYEVLAQWARTSTNGEIDVVTVADEARQYSCSHGLRVTPDTTWAELDDVDVLVVPGGRVNPLLDDEGFIARLRELAGRGALIASVCTGAFPLAKAGLLDGRRATTHWGSIDALAEYAPEVEIDAEARFVDTGSVITAAGVSAGIDMALHLVARLDSVQRAREVRRYIQYDPAPPV